MIDEIERVVEVIEDDWRMRRVLVVGDLMLDKYVWGDVERISPEAPIPVVRAHRHSDQPGGAANVASNIAALGASVSLIGLVGEDDAGVRLQELLNHQGVQTSFIRAPSIPTVTKLRVLAGRQQIVRLDEEPRTQVAAPYCDQVVNAAKAALRNAHVLILSDYAKGVLTPQSCKAIIHEARRLGVPTLVDPKSRDFSHYAGATTICPNLTELRLATGVHAPGLDSLLTAAQRLVAQLNLKFLIVTMSDRGIAVLNQQSRLIAAAKAREVFDVSGAGDTVIATLALCIASRLPIETAIELANIAAGVVVGKIGTAPIKKSELLSQLLPDMALEPMGKVLSFDRLLSRIDLWRAHGERIVFTNGCFDLLHVGHISLLQAARKEGDRLIVAINSDASISRLKGPGRPVVGEWERAQVLAALAAVDAVVAFDEPTPLHLIEACRPDVLVKGGDYSANTVVGASEVESWGGRVKIVPTVKGFSTTQLIEKSRSLVAAASQ
jgi:D-beta-D-heptose 7-phosphate kinase / D-beta-D-heptose 1-phosphate adenosyltransferase